MPASYLGSGCGPRVLGGPNKGARNASSTSAAGGWVRLGRAVAGVRRRLPAVAGCRGRSGTGGVGFAGRAERAAWAGVAVGRAGRHGHCSGRRSPSARKRRSSSLSCVAMARGAWRGVAGAWGGVARAGHAGRSHRPSARKRRAPSLSCDRAAGSRGDRAAGSRGVRAAGSRGDRWRRRTVAKSAAPAPAGRAGRSRCGIIAAARARSDARRPRGTTIEGRGSGRVRRVFRRIFNLEPDGSPTR